MPGTTLEVLTELECRRLLQENTATVGRIGVSVEAIPQILPVNFAMIEGSVVFRTGQGTKLAAAARNAVVAFEIDGSDASSGWSVLVVGLSAEVTDPKGIAAALAVIPDGWVPGQHEHIVRIAASRISGRRIHRHE
jgi:uncharacterized protein